MKNKATKKAIASYYILSLLLTLPLLIPIWLIKAPLGVIGYFVCFLVYMRIAVNFAVRATVMSLLWKELDAEKYAQIINAKPFWVHYSYKLNLYFATGNYQSAYNMIGSIFLQHKNYQQRIYGHLLLCRICFERGDYEGIKESLAEIDNYYQYNPNLKFSKQNKTAYDFYRAFSNADYTSAFSLLEKGIDKYSKKRNRDYFLLMRQYQLAVAKRMNGDLDEAVLLFETIKKKAPKLVLSSLSQKQLEIISGTHEEEIPKRLEITENYLLKSTNKRRIVLLIIFCFGCLLLITSSLLSQLDKPRQENKDLDYMTKIESTLVFLPRFV